MRKPTKLFLSLALAAATAFGTVPAIALAESASTSEVAAVAEAANIHVYCTVVGPSASGDDEVWVNYDKTYEESLNAADLTEAAIGFSGLDYSSSTSSWGWSLDSITSVDGRTLGMSQDGDTWYYWQLFVNGELAQSMADGIELADGDVVMWYYSAYGASAPDVNGDVVVDPDAARPSYTAEWNGFANAGNAVTTAATPTSKAVTSWVSDLKAEGSSWVRVSDPVLVNGKVYIAADSELRVYDQSSSTIQKTVQLAGSLDYTCRMVYADGLILVPLGSGRLQALTADTLTTVWITDALPAHIEKGAQQSLTPLTVADGCVYFGTAVADWSTTYYGTYLCVDLADGSVRWTYENSTAGFYWAGSARVGSYLVVGDDAGTVYALNASTGKVAGTLDLGSSVRSTVVSLGSNQALVASKDGVLHKLSVASNGALTEAGKVVFAAYSTCTPTVADSKAYVGGSSEDYTGVLSVIDVASMTVEHSVTLLEGDEAIPAQIQSTPVVSTQSDGTYAYFTSNTEPGGVYVYKLGDETAKAIFSPSGNYSNYCTSSIAVDGAGALYYTNDSGYLFKLVDPKAADASVEMYRLYNPNSGEHFYTASPVEKDTLVAAGWNYEGIAWTAPVASNTPVYRLYNPNAGNHHYTTSSAEKDNLVKSGWKYEGIGWYSVGSDGATLYRLYNPNSGNHHYTKSTSERDNLVKLGWRSEGIGWYGVK